MPRAANVFYRLVTDENSTTELLCNLMRFSDFRTPFLERFLSTMAASKVGWDDFETQVSIPGSGQPDIQIKTEEILVLIEVKTSPGLALSTYQSGGYFKFLRGEVSRERFLVFLVPQRWVHCDELNRNLGTLAESCAPQTAVHARILYWEDVMEIIEKNNLAETNPFLDEFLKLLKMRFGPKTVVFLPREVQMLFSKEIPTALAGLQTLVDGVRDRAVTYNVRLSASRSLSPSEYGLYFRSASGKDIFWFGVWMDFWRINDRPLCFGLTESSNPTARDAFLACYTGQTRSFQHYVLGWFDLETFSNENAVDEIWTRLSPLINATVAASD